MKLDVNISSAIRRWFRLGWGVAALGFTFVETGAQSPVIDFQYKSFSLENDAYNEIQNSIHLDSFFEALYELKTTHDRQINIVHIGDSHIQADYMTHLIRKNFQRHFGNAGRGLVVPFRVAGTNEPVNLSTSSTVTWESRRCVSSTPQLPVGIGGITIRSNQPGADLYISMNDTTADYSFRYVTLFYQNDENSFSFTVRDTAGNDLAFISPDSNKLPVDYTRVELTHPVNALTLQTSQTNSRQSQAVIYGLNLEKGEKGILYHSIGVNGARYEHYNRAERFALQLSALHPDLFIISLGTNEALQYPYLDKNFYQQIENLVSSLKQNNPSAKFILVTPPVAFRRKTRPNPGIQYIRDEIIRYAVENGYAFWDMYKVMGGEKATRTWKEIQLLRSDGVHYSREGYEYLGNLFYSALIRGYNQHVYNRLR